MSLRPLRLCLIDLNTAHVNQAMRCLRGIATTFFQNVAKRNPDLSCELLEVSPRDTNDPVPRDADLYVSSGGPGSPFEGDGSVWSEDYGRFSVGVIESAARGGADSRALFAICYSFEMVVRHFHVAEIGPRAERKFGVMPITTPRARASATRSSPPSATACSRSSTATGRRSSPTRAAPRPRRPAPRPREPRRRRHAPRPARPRRRPRHRGRPVPPRGRPARRDELGGPPRAGRCVQGGLRRAHLPGHAAHARRPAPPRAHLRAGHPRLARPPVQPPRRRARLRSGRCSQRGRERRLPGDQRPHLHRRSPRHPREPAHDRIHHAHPHAPPPHHEQIAGVWIQGGLGGLSKPPHRD